MSNLLRGVLTRLLAVLLLLGAAAGVASAINPILARRIGGAAVFNPNNYGAGSLRGWFKADSLALADGASVTTWPDSSGSGNDASGGTSPVYKAGIQNGKPGVLFTRASSQYLTANGLASISNGSDKPYTVIHVVKPVTLTTGITHIFTAWGSTSSATPRIWNYSNSEQFNALRRDDASSQVTASTAAVETTAAAVLSYVHFGTTFQLSRDGTPFASPASLDTGTITLDTFTIGASLAIATPANFFDGYMFEVLVYASALSDADRKAIERALGAKWGISVN